MMEETLEKCIPLKYFFLQILQPFSLMLLDYYAVDSKTKADMFNNYFLLHSKVDTSNTKLPNMDILADQTLNSINVTECKVFDQLQCLDTNKVRGHDGVSAKMLKEAGSTIVPSLCKLINTSLAQCKFPVGW